MAPDKPLLHTALLNCSASHIAPGRQAPCESARERSDQTAVSESRVDSFLIGLNEIRIAVLLRGFLP